MSWRYCPECEAFYGFTTKFVLDSHCLVGHTFSPLVNSSLFGHLTAIWYLFYGGQGIPMLPYKDVQQIRQFLSQWKNGS